MENYVIKNVSIFLTNFLNKNEYFWVLQFDDIDFFIIK